MTQARGAQAQIIRYTKPDNLEASKTFTLLAASDIAMAAVQIIREGGENNLHHHRHLDGIWFVLAGRARFYTTDDVLGEFGYGEGVLVPRGFPYWFESVGAEPLEILQVEARDEPRTITLEEGDDDRVDHTPVKQSYLTSQIIDART